MYVFCLVTSVLRMGAALLIRVFQELIENQKALKRETRKQRIGVFKIKRSLTDCDDVCI